MLPYFVSPVILRAVDSSSPSKYSTGSVVVSAKLHYSVTEDPPAHWAMRNMTNSAGFTGALPIMQISLPLKIFRVAETVIPENEIILLYQFAAELVDIDKLFLF
jgi:hypothetical protein